MARTLGTMAVNIVHWEPLAVNGTYNENHGCQCCTLGTIGCQWHIQLEPWLSILYTGNHWLSMARTMRTMAVNAVHWEPLAVNGTYNENHGCQWRIILGSIFTVCSALPDADTHICLNAKHIKQARPGYAH